MKKKRNDLFKLLFILIILTSCKDSSTDDENLHLMQEDVTGLQKTIDTSESITEENNVEEIPKNIEDCMEDYEKQGNDISTTGMETMFVGCLIEETHEYLNPVSHYEEPYLLVNIDIARMANEFSIPATENTEIKHIDVDVKNQYDLFIPFRLNPDHSILFQVGLDLYINAVNSLTKSTESLENSSSIEGGPEKISMGGTYKISIRDGYIGITTFWDTIKNRDRQDLDDESRHWHHQIRGGIEYVQNDDRLAVDYHHALTDWIYSKGNRKEHANARIDLLYEKTIDIIDFYLKGNLTLTPQYNHIQTGLGFGLNIILNCSIISMGIDLNQDGLNSRTNQLRITSFWDSRCL